MTATRKWSLMATVLVLAIFAAGWFLLISPTRTEAAGLRGDVVSQDDANARLRQQIEILQAQQAQLPQQRARLAVMRTQIPDNPALPTLIRNLTSAGRKVGVKLQALAPSVPVALVTSQPVAPVAPAETSSTDTNTTATGETDATGATADAPTAPVAPTPSLYQVPLKVEVIGGYFELEQFVNKLEGLKRSFLVSGFVVEEPQDEGMTPGDLKLTLQGRVFLSPPAADTTSTSTPVASAPAAQ